MTGFFSSVWGEKKGDTFFCRELRIRGLGYRQALDYARAAASGLEGNVFMKLRGLACDTVGFF